MNSGLKYTFLAFCITVLVPCQVVGGAEKKPVKVGVMLHLGGDYAAWGRAYLEGIELAQDEINSAGGINGRKLALITEDIRFDSRMTASASKKLIEIDHVPVALISTFTEVMVAGPIFERARVPLVVIGDSDEDIDRLGDYVFSTGSWVKGYAVSASEFMFNKLNLRKVALIATNNPWSQSTIATFKKDFEARGGEVLFSADVNPQESDFKTLFVKIKAQEIDGVFAPITSNAIPFFEQARAINLGLPVVTAGGNIDNDIIAAAPAAVEGLYGTASYLDSSRPQTAKLYSSYHKKYGRAPRYDSATGRGYDALLTISHALRAASPESGEQIKNALYRTDFEARGFMFK